MVYRDSLYGCIIKKIFLNDKLGRNIAVYIAAYVLLCTYIYSNIFI